MNKGLITTRKIPTFFILPFGYKVHIKQITRAQMAKIWGVHARSLKAKAFYHIFERTIYLCTDRSAAVRRNDLIHEMFHVMVDYQNDLQYMKCVDVKGK